MRTYDELDAFLNAPRARSHEDRPLRPRSRSRYDGSPIDTRAQRRGDGAIAVRLVETDILTFYACGAVTLNSGGWRTMLTSSRINDYLPTGWRLYSDRGSWFLCYPGTAWADWDTAPTWTFADGITILPDNSVVGDADPDTLDTERKIGHDILKYAKAYADRLVAGEIRHDRDLCAECAALEAWGDNTDLRDHLLSHMAEETYPAELILLALGTFEGAGRWVQDTIWRHLRGLDNNPFPSDIAHRVARSHIRRFFRRHCEIQV